MFKVLIVEDDKATSDIIKKYLQFKKYDVVSESDAISGVNRIEEDEKIDIVLMDIFLPRINGIEATRIIKEKDLAVSVIMMSAYSDEEFISEAVKAGADDFLIKPIKLDLLETRLNLAHKANNFNRYRKKFMDTLRSQYDMSKQTIDNLIVDNSDLIQEILMKLYLIADYETRKNYKESTRVGWLSGRIAEILEMPPDFCATIQFSAPLKDIGFIGVNDSILLKPSKLALEEVKIMRKHVEIGREILGGSSAGILKMGATIAYTHHERYNGSGYPLELSGEDVPIEGQIVGLTDTIDAMLTWRPYKEKKTLDEAFIELMTLKDDGFFSKRLIDAAIFLKKEIKNSYELD